MSDTIHHLVEQLRTMGCAVCCMSPDQLAGRDPVQVQEALQEQATRIVASIEPINGITPTLKELGFTLESTGGGCEAWYLRSGDFYVWLTADDGSTARNLSDAETLWLGYYRVGQDHSDHIDFAAGKWADLLPRIQAFKAGEFVPEGESE